jgi:hypothetical protein
MGQALLHAVSRTSPVWNDDLMLAWQQVIDAISFQIIGTSSNASSSSSRTSNTASTRTTRTSGDNPKVKNTDSSSRPPLAAPSMPLRKPLRQPSMDDNDKSTATSTAVLLTAREMVPHRMPLSPSRSFRNKKSGTNRHHYHHFASTTRPKSAGVLVPKTTTTTTTPTTTTTMNDSCSDSIMIMDCDPFAGSRFSNNNSFNNASSNSGNSSRARRLLTRGGSSMMMKQPPVRVA